jgi:hypothetical protein
MWYILILYFVGIFFYNVFVEDYDEGEEGEAQLFVDTFFPMLGIAASAILGLFF